MVLREEFIHPLHRNLCTRSSSLLSLMLTPDMAGCTVLSMIFTSPGISDDGTEHINDLSELSHSSVKA